MYTAEISDLRLAGPTVDCIISVTAANEDALRAEGKAPPTPIKASLLIDTGADRSAVRLGLLNDFGLRPVGIAHLAMATSQEDVPCPCYDLRIEIPDAGIREATVVQVPPHGFEKQGIDGLLGRDILQYATFIYIGTQNRYMLSLN